MQLSIAIVDPFFSGANFPAIAEQLGYNVLWIQSSPLLKLPAQPKRLENYVIYDNNLDDLLTSCKNLNVKAVFAGCENGVLLADALSEQLGLITNGTALSSARRDKGEMKKVFLNEGINCAKFAEFYNFSITDILQWMKENYIDFPVVLKPASGFGTINVLTCYNNQELKSAINILKMQDLKDFGITDNKFLVEEWIDGEEFMIDILGDGHNYFITDIWQYEKMTFNGAYNVYNCSCLINPDTEHLSLSMINEAIKATKALGIKYGCSHVELKVTSNNLIKIIEVGARIPGCHVAELAKPATNQDIELSMVKSFLGEKINLMKCYKLDKWACFVCLRTKKSGIIKNIIGIKEIKQLNSFTNLYLKCSVNETIEQTINLVTSPGTVLLLNKDQKQLLLDKENCHRLFDIEVNETSNYN